MIVITLLNNTPPFHNGKTIVRATDKANFLDCNVHSCNKNT